MILHSQLFLREHKYPIKLPLKFETLCRRISQKFKADLPEKWDLVFIPVKSDHRNRIISNQDDYELILKLSPEDGLKCIEVKESDRPDCTSSKINHDKENQSENSDSFEMIEDDAAGLKVAKIEKKGSVLQEKDTNRVPGKLLTASYQDRKEESFGLNSDEMKRVEEQNYPPKILKENSLILEYSAPGENHKDFQENQELQQKIERSLKDLGLDLTDLEPDTILGRKESRTSVEKHSYLEFERSLTASKDAEIRNPEIIGQEKNTLSQEEYKIGLEEFGLRDIDDVKEELEHASRREQRLSKNPNREDDLLDVQLKIKTLKKFMKFWEDGEKLKFEDQQMKNEQEETKRMKNDENPSVSSDIIKPSIEEEIFSSDEPFVEDHSEAGPRRDTEIILDQEKEKIKAKLQNLKEEILFMPDCFEKHLISMNILVSRVLYAEYTESEDSDFVKVEIPKVLNAMYERAGVEVLDTKSLTHVLDEISSNMKETQWELAKRALGLLLKQIQPLNISEIERLVKKGSEAMSLVKEKDVIMFIGETGVGKSTTLHYFAGSKMICQRGSHYAPIESNNSILAGVTTSASSASETRYIKCIPIKLTDIEIFISEEYVYFLDLPGYEDSNGAEVDISNAVNILRTIGECKSVKPLVLISEKSLGERMKGIKKLARILAGMLPNIRQNMETSPFIYLFTKFSEEGINLIEDSMKDVLKNLTSEEAADKGFCHILEDIVEKIKGGPQAINPLASKQANKLLISIIKSKPIPQPDQEFKIALAESSKAILQQQCNFNQKTILSAIERMDFDLVSYKLSRLGVLSELISLEFVEKSYEDSIQIISTFLKGLSQTSIKKFTRCFEDDNTLEEKDIKEFAENMKNAKGADQLRKKYLSKEVPSSSAFAQTITTQVNQLVAKIKGSLITNFSLKSYLRKLELLSQHFVNIKPEYTSSIFSLITKLNEEIEDFKSLHLKDEFEKSVVLLGNILRFVERLGGFLGETLILEKKNMIQDFLSVDIEETASGVEIIFTKKRISSEDEADLQKRFTRLRGIKANYKNQLTKAHIIISVYYKVIQKSKKYIEELNEKIMRQYEEKKYDSLSEVERMFKEITLVRKIPEVMAQTFEIYYHAHTSVNGILQQIKIDIIDEFKKIQNNQVDDFDYGNFHDLLLAFESMGWIHDFDQEFFSKTKRSIEREVFKHSETHKKQLMKFKLDLDHSNQLEGGNEIVLKLQEMRVFQDILPVLNKNNEIVATYFESKVEAALDKIDSLVGDWNDDKGEKLDQQKIEKSLLYLQKCQELSLFPKQTADLLQKLEILMKSSSQKDSEKLENYYQVIMSYGEFNKNKGGFENNLRKSVAVKAPNDQSCHDEILSCFSSASEVDLNLSTNKQNLMQSARNMFKLLYQALRLKRDCPNLYQIYDFEKESLLDYWKARFSSDLKELSEQMLRLLTAFSKSQEIQNKLHIVRELSVFDDEFMEGEKFRNIYEIYQTKYYDQINQKRSECIHFIKNGDYNQVLRNLERLRNCNSEEIDSLEQYEELKHDLSESLEYLMNETVNKTYQTFFEEGFPNLNKITGVVANINQLRKAQKYFQAQHLTFSVEKFQECQEKVNMIISRELDGIVKRYKSLISFENFPEAELQRKSFNQICRILQEKWEEDLQKNNEMFDQTKQEAIEEILKPYEDRPIRDYACFSPKRVYSSLELGKDDQYLNMKLEWFKTLIEEKCLRELTQTEFLDVKQKPDHLKMIRSLLTYLPQPVEMIISKKLEEAEEKLNKLKNKYSSDLQCVKKKGDAKKTAALLKTFKEMQMDDHLEDLEDHITMEVQQLKIEIIENLLSKNVEKAVKKLEEFVEEYATLDINGLDKVYSEVIDSSKGIVDSWYTTFLRGFNASDSPCSEKTEQSFVCMVKFIKRKKDGGKVQHILEELLSSTQIERMNMLIVENIKNYLKTCSEAFKSFDLSRISKVLKFAENCGHLIGYFQDYAIDNTDFYPSLAELKSMLTKVESSKSLEEKLCQMFEELGEEFMNIELINEETKFKIPREEFFARLNFKLCILGKSKRFEGLGVDVKSLFKQSCERIRIQICHIYQTLERLVERIFEDEIQKEEYDQFDVYFNNLVSVMKNVKLKNLSFDYQEIEENFKRRIGLYAQEIQSEPNRPQFLQKIAKGLQKLKTLSENISAFKPYIEGKISDVLGYFVSAKGSLSIPKLAKLLISDRKAEGSRIVSEYQIFKGIANSIFNSRTQKHDIHYVLKKIRGKPGEKINTTLLHKRFEEFDQKYKSLVTKFLLPDQDLSELVYSLKLLFGVVCQKEEEIKWNSEVTAKIPEILAHIFAIWTLQNAGSYFEMDDPLNKESYLMQPHAAQVISIFRLLGVGEGGSELHNSLAQIGTGEGKSITLAVTATVFALFGFNVFSACYSPYLCDRDFRAFSSLFSLLNISEKIRYGTFNRICEDVINQDGDVRQLVENLFMNGVANSSATLGAKNQSNCPSILLIDEVDVFFSKEFYGRLYTPSASIRDPTITKLIDRIWHSRNSREPFDQVKETSEYKDCCIRFSAFKTLLQEAVKDMLFDVREFESHDYVVKADKIGYKQCENISFKITCRYQTLFAYYLEHEKQNISSPSLEENKRLIIKCGSFSYAEIIRRFKYIIGVTGTLEHLSDMEKHVIENEYNIKKNTFLPSVFGDKMLNYRERDIIIANENDYYNSLKTEIINGMNSGKSDSAKRAVLVFFESAKKLREFLNSNQMADMKDQIEFLTEEANAEEKENIVRRATSSGRITFLTRSFGRGTDFVVHDQEVSTNGGIHVVQTFLSEEKSEEVQIKGRTARQGDQGSFNMVILDLSLEKFFILPEDLERVTKEGKTLNRLLKLLALDPTEYKNTYELMNARRNELFAQTYKNNQKYVIQAQRMHERAEKLLQSISSKELNEIRLFLVEENKGVSGIIKSRTMILTDGTYSMNPLHQNMKTTMMKACTNMTPILKEYGFPEDCFQIQIVVYRNYNSKEDKLLEFSQWEAKPTELTNFCENISVEGGWGNEAIEVALSHANQQHQKEQISQIILIGDAPANSPQEVEEKRKRLGESYWSQTKFAVKRTYQEEVKKLKENNIPVHSFYMNESAKQNFAEISKLTSGKSASLDIYSETGATILTNSITEALLKQIGDQKGKGDELVRAFRNKLLQSYDS